MAAAISAIVQPILRFELSACAACASPAGRFQYDSGITIPSCADAVFAADDGVDNLVDGCSVRDAAGAARAADVAEAGPDAGAAVGAGDAGLAGADDGFSVGGGAGGMGASQPTSMKTPPAAMTASMFASSPSDPKSTSTS